MAFMRRQTEPVPETETEVWVCKNEKCAGWMRADFSFSKKPKCPLCDSEMADEIRILPEIRL